MVPGAPMDQQAAAVIRGHGRDDAQKILDGPRGRRATVAQVSLPAVRMNHTTKMWPVK